MKNEVLMSDKGKNVLEFKYFPASVSFMFIFASLINLFICIPRTIELVFAIRTMGFTLDFFTSLETIKEPLINLLFSAVTAFMMSYLPLAIPSYKIVENGFLVDYFFTEVLVKWDDIVSAEETGFILSSATIFKIKTKKKFWIHYLNGIISGLDFSPCVIIYTYMKRYDDFVDIVTANVKR